MDTYIIYDEGGDTEVFERPDGTREKNEFTFSGFGNFIHPYHKRQTNWSIEMLKSAHINLLVIEVPTISDMSSDPDKGHMEVNDLKIKKISYTHGERTIILFQDREMGRGWAVLLELLPGGNMKIITQGHRDTVRDQTLLDAKWLKKQGVILKRKTVKNIKNIERFNP